MKKSRRSARSTSTMRDLAGGAFQIAMNRYESAVEWLDTHGKINSTRNSRHPA
jgi:hypothetical protein